MSTPACSSDRRPTGAQPASYGIHLNADGLAALHACLPGESWTMIDRAGVLAPHTIRFLDPVHGTLVAVDKQLREHATDPVTRRRGISRGRLRHALLHGTEAEVDSEPLVHWSKRFTRYELRGESVRAHFEDGSYADGDLLVGADGSSSRVRHQLLPQLERQALGIVNIAGRVPLSGALAAELPVDLTDGGINNVVPTGPGWLFFSTWDTGDPDVADVSGGAARYVVWAWAGARSSYPPAVEAFDGPRLKQLVQERIHDWSAPLRALVDETDASTVTAITLLTMPPLPSWQASRVTLLGDAIHNMTPMAGIGANTALRDADQLRRALLSGLGTPVEAVHSYETVMRIYANAALGLSTRNARNAALAPAAGRAVFRTLLRIAARVPMVKTAMFGPSRRTP